MEYGVSIGLQLPTGSPELDPLQAEGSASVLDRLLDQVGGADGKDGTEVSVTRFWIGAHPEGALILLVLEAHSLEIAEAAARDIMTEILDHSELLADWIIASCEVGFDERFAEAGLHAADGPDAPPADPTERARWLAEQSEPHPAQEGYVDEIDWRQWFINHAALARAFNAEVFDAQEPGLLAGALVFASGLIIDELFQDIETLEGSASVADSDGAFFVLDELPERFAQHYNGRFARQFLVTAVMVTGRLSSEEWTPPASVAEALALHLVVQRARNLLVEHDIVEQEDALHLYNVFEDTAFEDLDHEFLYRDDLDGFENDLDFQAHFGITDMRASSWFKQSNTVGGHVHTFGIDLDPPRSESPTEAS